MGANWSQDDVFPVIARIIGEAHQQYGGYVTHREITARLVEDRESRPLIEQVRRERDDSPSPEKVAGNMVAWFSQRITVGESEWGQSVERTKLEGQWAYKPAGGSARTPPAS